MGKDKNLLEQPLDEENETGAVVVGHVPWRQGRKNDRGENVGSCEESNVKIEQVNWKGKGKAGQTNASRIRVTWVHHWMSGAEHDKYL